MTEINNFINELKIEGEIRFDSITKKIYSVDASIYEVEPLAVAIPKTVLDLQKIVKVASRHRIPIIPRGAATGITGGCLGKGIVIDTSKYLKKMQLEENHAVCEPGVIQDELNAALSPLGMRLGPDTSTGDRATLGGMAGNNAAGARSMHFGSMVDAVESIDLVLCSGEIVRFGPLNEEEWKDKLILPTHEGDIYRAAEGIRTKYKDAILKNFPKLPRRASGYQLDRLLKPFPLNLAEIIVGSEGSLGVISSITVKLAKKPSYLELHLFPFDSMQEAMRAVPKLLKTSPIALEMIDDKILKAGKGKALWLKSIPKALLIAEYGEPRVSDAPYIFKDKEAMESVWAVRKGGLGLLLSKRSYSRAIAFIEDVSIPPEHLQEFMDRFLSYLAEKGKEAGIYGHVGPGCLHIRPYVDLRSPTEVILMKKMMIDVAAMVKEFGGAMSGEHGDGLIRSWLSETMFGKDVIEAFQTIKNAFDPLGLMNPHKIVQPLPLENDLRKAPKQNPATFLHFDGGLALSADLCNGNGACRKMAGVMCPSFQVTHDEYDTTRARANAFRSLLQEEKPSKLDEKPLHDILDLCIQCKGCKKECPSSVDMAKMKSEALYHYQEKYGYSLRSWLFAHLDTICKLPFKKLINFLGKNFYKLGGLGHPPPEFAKKRFSELILEQPEGKPCVLLSDTYTEFYCPEVGVAAIRVLNRLGYQAIIPPWKCCGRPAISKGFLPKAKKNAIELAKQLQDYPNMPIIGLEPSCLLTLFDEYKDFLGKEWNPKNCQLFDTFIANNLPLNIPKKGQVAVHGHCHQKAMQGMQDTLKVLRSLTEVIEIPSGCCGMAGSFGYEEEHSAFSKQIGELHLLPFVRSLPKETVIIANGYSCRTQISLYTGRKALHLAEWLSSGFLQT